MWKSSSNPRPRSHSSREKPIGITLGDPSGIGAEITAKALRSPSIRRLAHFHIIGDACLFKRYFPSRYNNCTFIDVRSLSARQFTAGKPSRAGAAASLGYLTEAIRRLKSGEIGGLITAPVCKEAIVEILPDFQGHTEFLAAAFGIRPEEVGMFFVAPALRVMLVTRHLALSKVSRQVTRALVSKTIRLTYTALRQLFRIRNPRIAVCGLNPHAGEGGTIGDDERRTIIPALQAARREKMRVEGPFAADTLFSPDIGKHYDAVVAMYHDQGLIPIKTLYFSKLVNLTTGLPFIRTSPAHGTAFDIAGKNRADASSMAEAIKLAAHLA